MHNALKRPKLMQGKVAPHVGPAMSHSAKTQPASHTARNARVAWGAMSPRSTPPPPPQVEVG